jgi:hypothetical protein
MTACAHERRRTTHGVVVRTVSTQLLIAAKIKDVAILYYDFLNHCGPRDFIHEVMAAIFFENRSGEHSNFTRKNVAGVARSSIVQIHIAVNLFHNHFFHLKIM